MPSRANPRTIAAATSVLPVPGPPVTTVSVPDERELDRARCSADSAPRAGTRDEIGEDVAARRRRAAREPLRRAASATRCSSQRERSV